MEDPERAIGADDQSHRIVLQAVHVGLTLNGKQLLSDVNATFEPNGLTAVMGPSGSGKTSLLRVLAGHSAGKVSGRVLCNGKEITARQRRFVVAVAPEDHMLLPELTVKETLYYASMLRRAARDRTRRADILLRQFSLVKLADQRVGDLMASGISGGQRKCIVIAIELLSNRPILLAKKLTSGLDAATAAVLTEAVNRVASSRIVVATIYQPSWSLLKTFSKILLLGLDGCVVFEGQPSEMREFFSQFMDLTSTNPADAALHAVASDTYHVRLKRRQNATSPPTDPYLIEWHHYDTYANPLIEQYRILVDRSARTWWRERCITLCTLVILVTVAMGFAQCHGGRTASRVSILISLDVGFYLTATLPPVIFLPRERVFIRREWNNGVFAAGPYWLAHNTIGVMSSVFLASLVAPVTYLMLRLPANSRDAAFILQFWLCLVIQYCNCSTLGLFLGVAVPSEIAGIQIVPSLLAIMLLTSGFIIPLSHIPSILLPVCYLNVFTWFNKIMLTLISYANVEAWERIRFDFVDIDPINMQHWWAGQISILATCSVAGYFATQIMLHRFENNISRTLRNSAPENDFEIGNRLLPSSVSVVDPSHMQRSALGCAEDSSSSLHGELIRNAKLTTNYGSVEPKDANCGVTISAYRYWYWSRGKTQSKQRVLPWVRSSREAAGHALPPSEAILRDVSLVFSAATATAILGPSVSIRYHGSILIISLSQGSGKSTLLNVVGGRIGGVSQGSIVVNGQGLEAARLRMIASYTPRDDNLLEMITVREALQYTAMLRSPRNWSSKMRERKIKESAALMGLTSKLNNVIGTVDSYGLSGGEKKRLSLCMDLLAERRIMVIDEPTTALDPATSLRVADALATLSHRKLQTIICTVQQPSWPLLCKFDSIILLTSGRVAYCSSPSDLTRHFGAQVPHLAFEDNPAESVLKILYESNAVDWAQKWDSSHLGVALARFVSKEHLSSLCDCTMRKREVLSMIDKSDHTAPDTAMKLLRMLIKLQCNYSSLEISAPSSGFQTTSFEQYSILTRRSFATFLKDKDQGCGFLLANVHMGILIGMAFYNVGNQLVHCHGGIFFGISSFSVLAMSGLFLNIPAEGKFVFREYSNGAHLASVYWLSRATVNMVAVSIASVLQVSIWWSFMGLPRGVWYLTDAIFATALLGSIFCHVSSLIGFAEQHRLRSSLFLSPFGGMLLSNCCALFPRSRMQFAMKPIPWINPVLCAFHNVINAAHRRRSTSKAELVDFTDIDIGKEIRNYAVLISWNLLILVVGCCVASNCIQSTFCHAKCQTAKVNTILMF